MGVASDSPAAERAPPHARGATTRNKTYVRSAATTSRAARPRRAAAALGAATAAARAPRTGRAAENMINPSCARSLKIWM